MIPLAICGDGFNALAGVRGKNAVELVLDFQDVLRLNLDIRSLALAAAGGLMNHDLSIGQCNTFSFRTGGKEKRSHGGRHSNTDGGHIGLDILHGVVNRKTGRHTAAGAVDIELNVLIRIFRFQIEQLCHNQAGRNVIHLFGEDNDAVIEEAGENVIGTLSPAGLLNYIRNQTHFSASSAFSSALSAGASAAGAGSTATAESAIMSMAFSLRNSSVM